MKLAENAVVHVQNAEQVGKYELHITFSDGATQNIDFAHFLRTSANPLIRTYLKAERFKQFAVKEGDLMWGDYELIFPIADLYEGAI